MVKRAFFGFCATCVLVTGAANSVRVAAAAQATATIVPGTVSVENFNEGGEGVGYHDTTPGNSGGEHRQSDVDIERSSLGGYDVGWIDAGEWLAYDVTIPASGSYTITLRVSSPSTAGRVHASVGGAVTAIAPVPNTGSWQTWTVIGVSANLAAGTQVLKITADVGGFNLAGISIEAAVPVPPAPQGFPVLDAGVVPPPPPPAPAAVRWQVTSDDLEYPVRDVNEVYSLPSQVQFMAAQNADVIVLQEVSTFNESQPTRYPQLLHEATGQTWYSFWVPGSGCLTQAGCFGDLIISRLPISGQANSFVPPSGMGRVQVSVGGIPINVFVIHLEAYNLGVRTSQLLGMMDWARSFNGPKMVGGDFNSWWGEWWIAQMRSEYGDTWLDVTGNQDGGYTIGNPGVRFDYWFRSLDSNGRVIPLNCFVPWTTLSDHRPVVADYQVQ